MGCIRLNILDEGYKSCEQKMFAVKKPLTFYKTESKERSCYVFGMGMPGRGFEAKSAYRYGYQGSEKDNDLNKNMYTTFFREVDTRIARWWGVDVKINSGMSPYVMMSNNPLIFTDVLGDSIDPKRTKGFNVFFVPSAERRKGDRAYTADYKKIKKFEKANPNNTIIIETDDPNQALWTLPDKLGGDGYVKNLLIDYHSGSFGSCSMGDGDVQKGLENLANNVMCIGKGSTEYI
jgi:RHS repeat-associated protein